MVDAPHIAPALEQSVSLRRQMTFEAMRVFSGWGYREIQVPLIDYFDSVKHGLDSTTIEGSVRFVDRRGDVMILRADITPLLAKIVAYQLSSRQASVPVRVSYANKVVRIDQGMERSVRESYQLGIELIGVNGLVGEIEVFLVALELMDRLGIRDYQLNVTDHGIARHLLRNTGAPARIRRLVYEAIVARDPYGVRTILRDLGIRDRFVEAVATLADLEGGLHQLQRLQEILPDDKRLHGRLEEIRSLFATLSALGYKRRIRIDMAELGGADYYTGIAFNVVSETAGRSLGRGGRYDDLLTNFGSRHPAFGFSISAESVMEFIPSRAFTSAGVGARSKRVEMPEGTDLVDGFRKVLDLRSSNQATRIVVDEEMP